MALIGLVRVSADDQDTARQRSLLTQLCSAVFDEQSSRRIRIDRRPEMVAALATMVPGDRLVVTRAEKLGPSIIDGIVVLSNLHERGFGVRVLEGSAAGDHVAGSDLIDLGRDIARLRRENHGDRIRAGLETARSRGVRGGRPQVVGEAERAEILTRREDGASIRAIARSVGVSVGTVHRVLAEGTALLARDT